MDLANQSAIGSALLVSVAVPDEPVTYFSTYWRDLTVSGTTYTGLGNLLSISDTQNDLRVTPQSLSLVISGIPSANQNLIREPKIKGSPITVKRYVFNPATGIGLSISDNPTGRFYGIINNWSMEFTADNINREASITIILECSSFVEILNNKIAGRRTNPDDQRVFYPGDASFDRVPNLARSNFDFGVPKS